MGWLWTCLGIKDKSVRRIGRRVSSDTFDSRLGHHYDFTKTPRIEDFLDPRGAGYDAFVNGHAPESPTPIKNSSLGRYEDENWESDSCAHAGEGNKRSHEVTRGREESASFDARIKGEYGPYWGFSDGVPGEGFLSIQFPRVPPSTRKSFSELLKESDNVDKGSLALDTTAAAAEKAAVLLGPSTSPDLHFKETPSAKVPQGVAPRLVWSSSSVNSEEKLLDVQGGANCFSMNLEPYEQLSQSPRSPHSTPLLAATKDHLEASNVVSAFKEARRQARMAELSSIDQSAPKPSYISSFLCSSRKSSLQSGSRAFQRSLPPVTEALPFDEELRLKQKSDVTPGLSFGNAVPLDRHVSPDSVSTSVNEPVVQQQEADRNSSESTGKKVLDAALATEDVSEFLFTEEWDDYVLVEKVQELPTQRVQKNLELVEAESASGSFVNLPSEQRDEVMIDNHGPGCGSSDEDAARSITGRILDESLASSTSSSEVSPRDEEGSLPPEDVAPRRSESGGVRQTPADTVVLECEGQQEDNTLMSTPIRDVLVTPEVFVSPKTTTSELNFTRVMDLDPEERPIFGSLADHWEAAWATKRSAWDGKGIPNSTHKYREDQKVMWHATSFEERLAQALASQEAIPERFRGPTSRFSASRNAPGLQAH
uniref:Uncharacterized protein n=1 Tax=Physcomitrium patens TaxID=3218 RepID=A0A7I4BM69_PHYPA|nr:uncharacterized protein LOC112272852 isoform X2 [Physcomitrium patens]|eukprot:XP_024356779.1 uncharacterized protein LOC112272852 isoform X2 [Physcomitrella patens]